MPKVMELHDIYKKQAVQKLYKRSYLMDLEKQVQDKKLREEFQRIYLDPKQMATSSDVMQKILPEMFEG